MPERLALVAGGRRLPYSGLDERSTRFGRHLLDSGLKAGANSGVLSWNRAEWLEAMLGTFKARMVPINLNYRYGAEELAHMLGDAEVTALVLESSFLPVLAQICHDLPHLRHVVALDDGAANDHGEAVAYQAARTEEPRGGKEGVITWSTRW